MTSTAIVSVKAPAVAAAARPSVSRASTWTCSFRGLEIVTLDQFYLQISQAASAPSVYTTVNSIIVDAMIDCDSVVLKGDPADSWISGVDLVFTVPASFFSGLSVGDDPLWLLSFGTTPVNGSTVPMTVSGPFPLVA